ncbi:MAG TPA: glycoside hydrolase family 2 TIM barrel-domain containing protein, partial [Chloroflexota bacterium]|nr:glycoside hydrolase family 2 TIM barrel-domain containing protein [Chloroflexota bacterium]
MTQSSTSVPRIEHPRPIFERQPWFSLNGPWRFGFDPRDIGEQSRWYRLAHPDVQTRRGQDSPGALASSLNFEPGRGIRTGDPFADEIVVPFPWESRLSGIGDVDYKGAAWYQRSLIIPAEWAAPAGSAGSGRAVPSPTTEPAGLPSIGDASTMPLSGARSRWRLHPFLCFGAVDWSARVWVNGRFAAEHSGGFTPFSVDLSNLVSPGELATLTVRVWDTSAADQPLGKQVERWYTHTGGIWQPVWVEGRPSAHLTTIRVTPHLEASRATFEIHANTDGEHPLSIRSKDGSFPTVETSFSGDSGTVDVPVPDAIPWSPENPHLYECTVSLGEDTVHTYFGLRSISRGRYDGKPYEYVFLNGEPVYLRGALDQAFHPEGIYSYPTDEAIRADVQAAKDLGLNMLRCHIKINDPRYYYWCDKLGVLMMYDLPSCDVYTPTARANWEATFRAAVERDYSHPCIFAWILFNETWGLEEHQTPASWDWVKEMYQLAKSLDSTRLVEDNSTNKYDHVNTDLNSWHFYIDNYRRARHHVSRVVEQTQEGGGFNYVSRLYDHVEGAADFRQATVPLLNSEYAALSARGGDVDISYSFKFLTSELRRHDKICGYVYTELSDIEWEHNGFLEYDRTWKEFGYEHSVPGMTVADLNAAEFVGLDCPPARTLPPSAEFVAPVFFSHWDHRPLEEATLRWQVTAIDRLG